MPRKILVVFAIVLTGGLVVAMVRGQDQSHTSASGQLTRERSVLLQRPASTTTLSQDSQPQSDAGMSSESANRPRLVDRLKQIRRSVVGDTVSGQPSARENGASRPTAARGGQQAESAWGDTSGSEPRLLPRRTGLRQDGDRSAFQSPPPASPGRTALLDQDASTRRATTVQRSPVPSAGMTRQPVENPTLSQRERVTLPSRTPSGALLSIAGPSLRVDTVGPQAILLGREAEYSIALTNQSDVSAHDVFVRVAIPTWVEIGAADATVGNTQLRGGETAAQELIWNVSQFAAGAREVLTLKLIPRENRAFNLAVDWTLRPVTSVAQIEVQQPELEMAVFGPSEILYGETAVYTIQLSNPGSGDAEDVTVDFGYGGERLPTRKVGNLAAGEQTEISVELTARQAGGLRIAAAAAASGGLRAEANEQVLVRRAKLDVNVIGSAVKFAGSVASYEFQIRNIGDAAAADVMAHVVLPAGAKYVGHDALQESSESLVKELGTISPGSERSFRLQCELTNPGENLVEARATGGGNLVAADTFITSVKALADLKLGVNDPPGPVAIGTPTVYEVQIVNRGTRAAQQVQVVAQFSKGVEPTEANGAKARLIPGQVLFQPIPRIEPGEEVRLRITAKADQEGNHRFRAEVKCSDPPDTILVAEETTYFFGDDLSTARQSSGSANR